MKYIGSQKIKTIKDNGDGFSTITFKDGNTDTVENKLLTLISSDKERAGTTIDVIQNVLGARFLEEMGEYGLDINMIQYVTQGMANLAYNLREELIRKTFNCSGTSYIKISQLLEE